MAKTATSDSESKKATPPKGLEFRPRDGGKTLVSLSDGSVAVEVEFPNEHLEREAEKLGLGRPTPQTPHRGDRVTG